MSARPAATASGTSDDQCGGGTTASLGRDHQCHTAASVAVQFGPQCLVQRAGGEHRQGRRLLRGGRSAPARRRWCRFRPSAGSSRGTTPLAVNHEGQFVAATISFNLPPGKSLGDATTAIDEGDADLRMPASVTGSFAGTAQAFQQIRCNNEPWC